VKSDLRPDPEALIASLQREEARARRGRLKVFLGMCPGVGKTYAMLRAAQQARAEEVDVVVGIVETHGRAETEAMTLGLEILPRLRTEHRGAVISEMDVDALLARRPALAVVDELAHTNAPGSRHAKRWQDVVELIDAGIDVHTTLNIQHVESRADAVRQITGAVVRETVPDSVLDLAEEVELLDLTPGALRERLREGRVYMAERAATAADHFFQESNLNALRELALRFTAERVDRELRALRSTAVKTTVWRSGERLLVAVGPSPFSTQLVRWTRRLAAAQGASWLAVHVEGSRVLTPEAQRLLDSNLSLARELGAEVVVTHDDDVCGALVRVALRHDATQIVVGKPRESPWWTWLRGGSLVDRLLRRGGNIDIYVVPADPGAALPLAIDFEGALRSRPEEFGWAVAVVVAVTCAGQLLPADTYLAVGLVYLLAVAALGLRIGRGPVLLAGLLSAATWNFLFIPPRFTFHINRVEDALLFAAYFVVALIVGQLAARIRGQMNHERSREERATALFELTRVLTEARDLDGAMSAALRQIDRLFGVQSALLLPGPNAQDLVAHFAGSFAVDEKERAVAVWVFRHGRPAGRFTDTLPAARGYHLPLVRDGRAVGVLGVFPSDRPLPLAQRDLLDAFGRQLALMIEREQLHAASEREKLLAESSRLHRALLDSVSHELRTPLAVITGVIDNLGEADPGTREQLLTEGRTATRRLNRVVSNLLDQTRLESGALRTRPDWCDVRDIVNAAIETVGEALDGRPLHVEIPVKLPPLFADFVLTEQALANLLLNAAMHTPAGTAITVTADIEPDGARAFLSVADRGPGIAADDRERIFGKFFRAARARAGGLGLGLSIVQGFAAAQGGSIECRDNPGGGAVFTFYLPHRTPQAEGVP
jgi:two-component system, OmpR family, sensor histidine kinase KdpD